MTGAPRLFVTGTDTDVGKTRVTAALALAFKRRFPPDTAVTIVKAVQTGLAPGEEGDAEHAARLAGCSWRELARYGKAADGYAAALAEGREPARAGDLAAQINAIDGVIIVEGSGGAAVPINAEERIAEVAAAARLQAVVAVGLKLGCISHALLTAAYLRVLGVRIAGAVLVERWGETDREYRADVIRSLAQELPILAYFPYEEDEAEAVDIGAECLAGLIGPSANSPAIAP